MKDKIEDNKKQAIWAKPELKELGKAKDLIKEAKFSGFSGGVTFQGSPIGESN